MTENNETVSFNFRGNEYKLPLIEGSEGELAIDIRKLRKDTGLITLDPGYLSTGSTMSSITFIDGEEGILRYRGYSIEELAQKASFTEVMYLLIWGELPTKEQLKTFEHRLNYHDMIHEDMKNLFSGFPATGHPMGMLSSMITSLSTYYQNSEKDVDLSIFRLLAKFKTIAAYTYRKSLGFPYIYPDNTLNYVNDFIKMMFSQPTESFEINEVVSDAVNKLLILHADHEQNCSASTVRMVGSSKGSIYTAIAAGVSALWGPLHGGANQAVIEMLSDIKDKYNGDIQKVIELAKDSNSNFRLMGFGHRVYKNFDPRAKILKESADAVLKELGIQDELLDIAKQLEEVALRDEYFVKRKLYPNVDFYSGIIYRALGIPPEMFTIMFALGRLPGWIAQWKELKEDPDFRIYRPRQVYTGPTFRNYKPLEER
ncbi:MAG: citrate synthase [Asgard group archaeon]|jgi:citrate synthase|nr:citrate synthase [Asgard group archaeon]